MSRNFKRACRAAAGLALVAGVGCAVDQTGPTQKTATILGRQPNTGVYAYPGLPVAQPELITACINIPGENSGKVWNVEFQVDTITQQGSNWEPRLIASLHNGECLDVWVNGGVFKDYVRLSVIAPGKTKTYIQDDVFRPVPIGNSSGDIHTYTGPVTGNMPVGFADGKHGMAAVFTIQ